MIKFNGKIKFFIVFLIFFSFFFTDFVADLSAKPKKAKKTSSKSLSSKGKKSVSKGTSKGSKKVKSSSKSTKKKKKKRRRRSRRPPFKDTKLTLSTPLELVSDTSLVKGVKYRNYMIGGGKYKHYLHTIEIELDSSDAEATVIKAGEHIDALVKLQEIGLNHSAQYSSQVLGLINANFWKAGSNYPIGPVVMNGEIVEMLSYKQWSSAMLDSLGRIYINNFSIKGSLLTKNNKSLIIRSVNHRKDSLGLVIYNRFAGDTIPFIEIKNISSEINDALEEAEFNMEESDSTEEEIDTALIMSEILAGKRSAQIEYSLPKLSLKYLDKPLVNDDIRCKVISIDTGAVSVPENGCIASFGKNYPSYLIPKVGDIITLKYETNTLKYIPFYNAVCGTPRLVRKGSAQHEAAYEGSRGRRFISWQLPRTAIGTNKAKNKIILLTVEGTGLHLNCYGANLTQLSIIMKRLGCYDAMNLDGGGSTIMTIGGKNVLLKNKPEHSRRLSVAVGAIINKKINESKKKTVK